MRIPLFLSLLFAITFFSCENEAVPNEKTAAPAIDSTDEIAILNLALDEEVGSDSAFRHNSIPLLLPGEKDPQKIARHQHFADSIALFMDTMHLVLYINPESASYEHGNLRKLLSLKMFSANFIGIDSAYIHLLKQMADSVRKVPINASQLHSTYNYSLAPAPPDFWKQKRNRHDVGPVGLSTVYFDSKKLRACIYATYWCGELCGDGTIYFLEKKNGKWMIVGSRCMWVS